MSAFYNPNGKKSDRFMEKYADTHISARAIAKITGMPLHKVKLLLPHPACIIMPGYRGVMMWEKEKVKTIFGVDLL